MCAKLARFYGWSHEEIVNLDFEIAEMYWEAITQLEAQDVLVNLRVVDYPHMKNENRRKTHKDFHRLAYPRTHDTTRPLTTQELASRLKGVLGGK